MRILGIETSCDETAAAVIDDGRVIRSNIVASQLAAHERFGGVVPEIASRQHVLAIVGVTREAMRGDGYDWSDIGAIAVTRGPGLSGALLVGINFAKGLSLARRLPLLAVNHVEAHVYSVWLSGQIPTPPAPLLPMVALIVSGGHTELVLMLSPGHYRVLGRTLDDAAGEAFDKVGRLLGLPYPGGPSVERVARTLPQDIEPATLPRAWLPGTYDFSFSGLKTATLHMVSQSRGHARPPVDPASRGDTLAPLEPVQVAAIARGFQDSVVDVLATKLARAAKEFSARSVAVVGGVAANEALRAGVASVVDVDLHVPEPGLSTDNAAMIAAAAFFRPVTAGYDTDADPSLSWSDDATLSA